ncbi:unnamed protein product, partial [Lymnaea stagnalis]
MLYSITLYFILLAVGCVCANEDTIKLFQYRQEDSVTSCTHGLVSGVDTVVFKAEVDMSENNLIYIYFQRKVKTASDYLFFYGIPINGSETETNGLEIIHEHIALITIKDKAKTENSGARIRGILVSSDHREITSEEQIYPDMRESTDLKRKLLINGVERTVQENICDIHVHGIETVIIYECNSHVLPCLIEISATDLITPLYGRGYVLHKSNLSELSITLKYGPCTLTGKVNTFKCHIKRDNVPEAQTTREESSTHFNEIFCWISFILISIFLIVLLWRIHQLKLFRVFFCCNPIKNTNFNEKKIKTGTQREPDEADEKSKCIPPIIEEVKETMEQSGTQIQEDIREFNAKNLSFSTLNNMNWALHLKVIHLSKGVNSLTTKGKQCDEGIDIFNIAIFGGHWNQENMYTPKKKYFNIA